MKKEVRFHLNGEEQVMTVEPQETLAFALRRMGLTGTKVGCNEGCCGSCTVLLDGRAVYACLMYACHVEGRTVRTIEHFGSHDEPHPLQVALADHGAVQCGFCMPGMILAAAALLEENPKATEPELIRHLDGNLCRCTGYEKIQDALRSVMGGSGS
ncbi:MAG TPA: (2Fe-2S)-binding protein [Kiritimatiellia bacterium]|nr:(2Fe-2S)-binding protein [Kiritimatiellia bacterium]